MFRGESGIWEVVDGSWGSSIICGTRYHEVTKSTYFKFRHGRCHTVSQIFKFICTASLLEVDGDNTLMPGSDSKARKVKAVTDLIRSQSWSFNDFLIAFYSSGDASIATQQGSCLVKGDDTRFAPEELLGLWFDHCPSSSQSYLEHIIIDRASRIIVKEADKACALKSLSVSTTSVEADDLDKNFLLSKLETEYTGTLPHLWYLLNTVIASSNRSEQQKQQVAASKETRAAFVESSLGRSPAV